MTGTKTASVIVRMCGVLACVAVAVSGWDAEAGWRRRCCKTPCCEPVCCEPVCCETVRYEPACCETRTMVTACPARCTTCYDACGRRIDCGCGEVVVTYRTVTPIADCCDMATNGGPQRASTAGKPLAADTTTPTEAVRPVATRSVLQR